MIDDVWQWVATGAVAAWTSTVQFVQRGQRRDIEALKERVHDREEIEKLHERINKRVDKSDYSQHMASLQAEMRGGFSEIKEDLRGIRDKLDRKVDK